MKQWVFSNTESTTAKPEAIWQRWINVAGWPEKYGGQRYRTVLAGSHWSVYILLGKLKPTVFIVQKEQLHG